MHRDPQGYRTVRLRTLLVAASFGVVLTLAVAFWLRESLFQHFRAFVLGNAELAAEKYGRLLGERVDEVEVFEIEPARKGTNSVTIRLGTWVEHHDYSAMRALSGSEAEAFLKGWGKMRFHWGLSGLCHDPAFVLRFTKNGRLEWETTLCFLCQNFQYASPIGLGTMGFDEQSPAGQAFVAQVRALFPNSPKWTELEKQKQQKSEAKE